MARRWSGRQRAVLWAIAAYAVLWVWMFCTRPWGDAGHKTFADLYQILPPLGAALCAFGCAWRGPDLSPAQRIGWALVGVACVFDCAAEALWAWHEIGLRIEPPYPSWTDVWYLTTYPFLIAGVMCLFGAMPLAQRARLMLDGAIAAASVGLLSWYVVILPLWNQSAVSPAVKYVGIAYPLFDLALIFSVFLLFSAVGSNAAARRPTICLALGGLLR